MGLVFSMDREPRAGLVGAVDCCTYGLNAYSCGLLNYYLFFSKNKLIATRHFALLLTSSSTNS